VPVKSTRLKKPCQPTNYMSDPQKVSVQKPDWIYRNVLKPIFFRMDPEDIHDRFTLLGSVLAKTPPTRFVINKICRFDHPMLETSVDGIQFKNPKDLAAGFDKNAKLWNILPDVGFGFAELGTVTPQSYEGNPKPRLARLPKDESIIVNYGLKNDGAQVIRARLAGKRFRIPIGISIARTNTKMSLNDAVKEYATAFRTMHPIGSFTTINVSCPNTSDGRTFCSPDLLEPVLKAISKEKHTKPVYVKFKSDINGKELKDSLELIDNQKWVSGVILSNLRMDRSCLITPKEEWAHLKGHLSGRPTRTLSLGQIKTARKITDKTIIGVGGIFTAEHAYEKIREGASLVQMVTGLIYEGPRVVGRINKGLVELLKRDGFSSIKEAVGSK